jgi:hypothetical protein
MRFDPAPLSWLPGKVCRLVVQPGVGVPAHRLRHCLPTDTSRSRQRAQTLTGARPSPQLLHHVCRQPGTVVIGATVSGCAMASQWRRAPGEIAQADVVPVTVTVPRYLTAARRSLEGEQHEVGDRHRAHRPALVTDMRRPPPSPSCPRQRPPLIRPLSWTTPATPARIDHAAVVHPITWKAWYVPQSHRLPPQRLANQPSKRPAVVPQHKFFFVRHSSRRPSHCSRLTNSS